MRRLVWWVLRGYQLTLSAFFGRTCRFEPSCSHYAQDAVMRFGVLRGGWLAVKRISRCNPWGGSGFDPVPEALEQKAKRGGLPSKGTSCSCGGH